VRYAACFAQLTPKVLSGGFVWYPYSVIHRCFGPYSFEISASSTLMLPIWMRRASFPLGTNVGDSPAAA
jgi:hypothetical protein